MKPNFDTMSFQELWDYRIEHQISIPNLGALLTADVLRIREREKELKGALPPEELHFVPTGRHSTTVVTKAFGEEFRAALKDLFKSPLSRQTFETLRQRILTMSFQELVEWNGLQNLLSKEELDRLYEREHTRALNNIPQTECSTRGPVSVCWSEEHVADFRAALVSAIDQKEKDFVNEHAS